LHGDRKLTNVSLVLNGIQEQIYKKNITKIRNNLNQAMNEKLYFTQIRQVIFN